MQLFEEAAPGRKDGKGWRELGVPTAVGGSVALRCVGLRLCPGGAGKNCAFSWSWVRLEVMPAPCVL